MKVFYRIAYLGASHILSTTGICFIFQGICQFRIHVLVLLLRIQFDLTRELCMQLIQVNT